MAWWFWLTDLRVQILVYPCMGTQVGISQNLCWLESSLGRFSEVYLWLYETVCQYLISLSNCVKAMLGPLNIWYKRLETFVCQSLEWSSKSVNNSLSSNYRQLIQAAIQCRKGVYAGEGIKTSVYVHVYQYIFTYCYSSIDVLGYIYIFVIPQSN